jgi:hypothetical protein
MRIYVLRIYIGMAGFFGKIIERGQPVKRENE